VLSAENGAHFTHSAPANAFKRRTSFSIFSISSDLGCIVIAQMSRDSTLIHLVNSYDSGEITRNEFQKRVRALPPVLISRVAEILTETSGYSSKCKPIDESLDKFRTQHENSLRPELSAPNSAPVDIKWLKWRIIGRIAGAGPAAQNK